MHIGFVYGSSAYGSNLKMGTVLFVREKSMVYKSSLSFIPIIALLGYQKEIVVGLVSIIV